MTGGDFGPRAQPPWIVRNGIWLMLAWTAILFAIAARLPFANVLTVPLRLPSGIAAIARSAADGIRPASPVTINAAGRTFQATIAAVLPAGADSVALRVAVPRGLPADPRATVSVSLARSTVLSQLLHPSSRP